MRILGGLLIVLLTLALSKVSAEKATLHLDFGVAHAGKEVILNLPLSDGRFLYLNHVKQNLNNRGRAVVKVDLTAPGIVSVGYQKLYDIYMAPGNELSIKFFPVPEFSGDLAEENKFLFSLDRQGIAIAMKKELWPAAMKKLTKLSTPDSIISMADYFMADEMMMLDSVRREHHLSKDFVDFVKNEIHLFYFDVAFSSFSQKLLPYLNFAPVQDSSQVHSGWGEGLTTIVNRMLPIAEMESSHISRHAFACLYDLIVGYRINFLKENISTSTDRSVQALSFNLFSAAPVAIASYLNAKSKEFYVPNHISFFVTGTVSLYSSMTIEMFDDYFKAFPSSPYLPFLKQKYREVQDAVDVADVKPSTRVHIVEGFEKISDYRTMIAPYKGKVVYIDIWAMWCSPCIREFGYYQPLMDLAKKEKDFVILFLSRDNVSAIERWTAFINNKHLEGFHMIPNADLEKDLRARVGWQAIPRYVIVNVEGEIVDADAPPPSDDRTIDRIKEMMAHN